MKRILYAEDDYANRAFLQFQLKREGVQCDTAIDGFEALDMFGKRRYSVVILDHYMPGLNGSEVAKRIRDIDAEIPLIAITSDDSQLPALRNAGFNSVFLKPLHGQDYISTIIGYL